MGDAFIRCVASINNRLGTILAWLFLPFSLLVVVDVFTRYVLNKPGAYYDIEIQVMGLLIALGIGYCYTRDGHVTVDILVNHLSSRKRATLNMILFPVFLAGMVPIVWALSLQAWYSITGLENYTGILGLPIYPLKVIILLGFILVILEGIAKFIGNIKIAFPARSRDVS